MKIDDLQRVKDLSEELSYLRQHRTKVAVAEGVNVNGVGFLPVKRKETWNYVQIPQATLMAVKSLLIATIDAEIERVAGELRTLGVEVD
ncbi:MAG: hypothetical protein RJA36_1410 [Pseudomonadota bacterium]|jgi:hypothetical protein